MCFQEGLESGEVAFWNVDDLVTDIDTVVAIDFLDFVDMDDVGTMDAKKLVFGQHFFYSLHCQVSNQCLGLIVKVEHHIVLHAIYIRNLVDSDIVPFSLYTNKNGIWLGWLWRYRLLI